MNLFLIENIRLKPVNHVDSSSLQSHPDQVLLGLRTAPKEARDHEFSDILEATISELELQDVILANQMALRRM